MIKQLKLGGLLSPRERQISILVRQSKLDKEIAFELGLSRDTVHAYMGRIFIKVGARNRVALAVWAVENLREVENLRDLENPRKEQNPTMALIDVLDPNKTGPLLDKLSDTGKAIVQQAIDGLNQLSTEEKSILDTELSTIRNNIEQPVLDQLATFNQTAADLKDQVIRIGDLLDKIVSAGLHLEMNVGLKG